MPRANEHVVVIGGTSGLGHHVAQASAALGARVTITGRDLDRARHAAQGLSGDAAGCSCDLTDWDSIDRLFQSLDRVDHLILCALQRDHNTIADFDPGASARTSLMKNVGYAAAVHFALPRLSSEGSVVMFSGLSMWMPMPGSTTISMANAGVIGLVNSLATQIAPVRVNAVTPGVVAGTSAVDDADAIRTDRYAALKLRTPGQRLPTPADIVAATFALTDNPGINGANLVVDGGMHLA